MKLLAIDTVTPTCSAALLVDGTCRVRVETAANRHSALVLPMVDALLAEAGLALADLDALAFDRGPGSFTGLRIGAGVIQGLAFATSLPVIGVSSLEALAAGSGYRRVLAAVDARMGQVYWAELALGEDGEVIGDGAPAEHLGSPAEVRLLCPGAAGDFHGVGSGWDAHGAVLSEVLGGVSFCEGRQPMAADVARIAARRLARGEGLDAVQALPVYLREKVTDQGGGS